MTSDSSTPAEAERQGLRPFAGPYQKGSIEQTEWYKAALSGLMRRNRPVLIVESPEGLTIYSDKRWHAPELDT